MRLRLFRAVGMQAAMAELRAALGPDALILDTRRVAGGVEITAALEPDRVVAEAAPLPDPVRLQALGFHAVPPALQGQLQIGDLATALAAAMTFGDLPLGTDAPPLLFCGPPGAGKTLTVARLAARLVLGGARPLVIAADDRRAAATEQLATFTDLLGISLIVACQPIMLARALARRGGTGPVLIDSAGSDPFDPPQVEELAAFAAAAPARLVLVLPGGLDPAEAADLAAAYTGVGATHMVATRLDLTHRLGGILAAATSGPLILTEAGVAPRVADGLMPLTPEFLAERLMHVRTTAR